MIKIPEITSEELLNRLETALYSNEELEHSQHFQNIKNMEVNPDDIDSDLQNGRQKAHDFSRRDE